ncbi:MAG: cation:proton antiporter, partial [Eubacterium sp.]|nr:cation:proton antiporter [Eubacterium sp.]
SAGIKISKLKSDIKLITSLSLLTTLLGAVIFGALFFLVSKISGVGLSFPICLLFGAIVSPTDPIAATSILRKFNLPRRTGLVIEAESLFNDGVGVALFVCFSGIVKHAQSENFFLLLFQELGGGIAVGLAAGFLSFQLFKRTSNSFRRIAISLMAVAGAYAICTSLNFSGPIAAVVCGIFYATQKEKLKDQDFDHYDKFWEVIDVLANSAVYVIIGFYAAFVLNVPNAVILFIGAVIVNTIARAGSVSASAAMFRPLPDQYSVKHFTSLLTWGGLKGGLCLALALSTISFLPEQAFHIVAGCTFVIVFFTTVIQGLTMPRVYSRIEKQKAKQAG